MDTKTDFTYLKDTEVLERENIDLFIKSIRKYHTTSTIIHCTDISTETFKDVDIVRGK